LPSSSSLGLDVSSNTPSASFLDLDNLGSTRNRPRTTKHGRIEHPIGSFTIFLRRVAHPMNKPG
jgi:hypothetical protein